MSEKNVRVSVEMGLKGGEKAARDSKKVMDSLRLPPDAIKNMGGLDKAAGAATKQFSALGNVLKNLNQLFRSRDGVNALADQRKEAERLARTLDSVLEKQNRSKLAFSRGVAQGLGVGEYFPEQTPGGFGRNLAGRAVGGFARRMIGGVGGGMAAMPFTGASGLSTSLGALPGGGLLQGQLQASMGNAASALGYVQQQHSMNRFMGGSALRGIAGARSAAMSGVTVPTMDEGRINAAGENARRMVMQGIVGGDPTFDAVVRAKSDVLLSKGGANTNKSASDLIYALTQPGTEPGILDGLKGWLHNQTERTDTEAVDPQQRKDTMRTAALTLTGNTGLADKAAAVAMDREREAQRKAIAEAEKQRADLADTAELGTREKYFEFLRTQGKSFGLTPEEALQFGGGMLGATGRDMGALDSKAGQNALMNAMGAQARFGIGAELSGGLMRGTRTGAFGATGGDPSEVLNRTVRGGRSLNLSGDDLTKYLADIAQAVQNFESTGIPVADESITGLARGLAPIVGSARGMAMANQLGGAVQGMRGGPKNSAEFLLMSTFGGYKGGGVDDFFDAKSMMESGKGLTAENFQKFVSKVSTSGNGKQDALALQNVLGKVGVNVGVDKALDLVKGNIDPEFMNQLKAAGSGNPGNLADAGRTATAEALKRNAMTSGEGIDSGLKALPAMQDLNSIAARMTTNFTKFAEQLQAVTGWGVERSKDVSELVTKLHSTLDEMMVQLRGMK